MSGKKITFTKKPVSNDPTQYIDNWVRGNNNPIIEEKNLKRTTIYLPETIHKTLKIEAAKLEKTMTDLIIEALEKYTH